jgi:CBS domain containing-hemolysin-like protein
LINPIIEIEQINDDIGLGIPEGEDYDTLGGFLLYKYGSFPGVGEKILFSNKTFEITKATNRSIDEVGLKIK